MYCPSALARHPKELWRAVSVKIITWIIYIITFIGKNIENCILEKKQHIVILGEFLYIDDLPECCFPHDLEYHLRCLNESLLTFCMYFLHALFFQWLTSPVIHHLLCNAFSHITTSHLITVSHWHKHQPFSPHAFMYYLVVPASFWPHTVPCSACLLGLLWLKDDVLPNTPWTSYQVNLFQPLCLGFLFSPRISALNLYIKIFERLLSVRNLTLNKDLS